MSAKYCISGPLNLHLLNLFYLCYFMIFLASFGVLVFYRSLKKMIVSLWIGKGNEYYGDKFLS
jgi:hypothetical protein